MHAYTGYGSQETALNTPEVARAETVLPYRTYVEVTITEATARVAAAGKARVAPRPWPMPPAPGTEAPQPTRQPRRRRNAGRRMTSMPPRRS